MVIADWVAIGIVLGCLVIGGIVGFGSWLKFFTSGIFGFIISIIVCALIGTTFLNAAEPLLTLISSLWAGKEGGFFAFLDTIRIDIVIYYIGLFILVQLVRLIFVQTIKHICDSDNGFIRFINRTLGALLFLAFGAIVTLLVIAIIGWVGNDTAVNLSNSLQGSLFKLDVLFEKLTGFVNETLPAAAL